MKIRRFREKWDESLDLALVLVVENAVPPSGRDVPL